MKDMDEEHAPYHGGTMKRSKQPTDFRRDVDGQYQRGLYEWEEFRSELLPPDLYESSPELQNAYIRGLRDAREQELK